MVVYRLVVVGSTLTVAYVVYISTLTYKYCKVVARNIFRVRYSVFYVPKERLVLRPEKTVSYGVAVWSHVRFWRKAL